MKKLKYFSAALLISTVFCTFAAYAEETTEYLFKFKNGADFPVSFLGEARLQSAESPLCSVLGIYSTYDKELISEYLEMGILEFYEENAPAYLLDMPNTSEYKTTLASGGVPVGESYAQLNVNDFWQLGLSGKGLKIAVIDSGANPHSCLTDNLLPGKNTYASEEDIALDPSLQYNALDGNGHGTMVSGFIAANGTNYMGIAYEAKIVPIKAFSDSGSGSTKTMAAGIMAAVDEFGCDIINMSCGSLSDSETLKKAVTHAYEAGVPIISASGNVMSANYGTATVGTEDSKMYPACYDAVISVGNIDRYDSLHNSSMENSFVDVVAPGKVVTGLLNTNNSGFRVNTGTSFSCPIVTGVVALMLQADPTLTIDEIESTLQNTATDLGDVGFDISYGYGKVNCQAIIPYILDGRVYRSQIVEYRGTYNRAVRNGLADKTNSMLVFAKYNGGKMTERNAIEAELGYGESVVASMTTGGTVKLFEQDKTTYKKVSDVVSLSE